MIQDISPHRFYNEYLPGEKPGKDSPVLVFDQSEVLIRDIPAPSGMRTIFPSWEQILHTYEEHAASGAPEPVYAFRVDDTRYFLCPGQNAGDARCLVPDGFSFRQIREVRSFVSNPEGLIAFTGYHLYHWYTTSRFCGCCGHRTVYDRTERAMLCPSCGNKIYPRLNPAVIVGVLNQDRMLVTKYRTGFDHYALIAGFAEIGETLEETVAREVREETGLSVANIRYYKSQPWGIAQDLLSGFFCEVQGDTDIRMDPDELRLAAWSSREEIVLQPDSLSLTNEMMKLFKEGKI